MPVLDILKSIPTGFLNFILVAVFSLLIGLEQRRHHMKESMDSIFGTDRTFALIGVLGYVLYILSPLNLTYFFLGGVGLVGFLSIYYYRRVSQQQAGLTSIVAALITYCLAPLVFTQTLGMFLLVVVSLLVITELKETLVEFSKKFDHAEFTTLAKFIVVSGIILPLLPDEPISYSINVSPYRAWLAVVIVSTISYVSYIAQKFVFPESGILITGILGGLYSSTATTVVLARKTREEPGNAQIAAAIMLATSMMYVRIFLIAYFMDREVAMILALKFGILAVISALPIIYFLKFRASGRSSAVNLHSNPLEFRLALIFAFLFVLFAALTTYAIKTYGERGVAYLAFLVGVVDIDPFILNLFQKTWALNSTVVAFSIINATNSNNLLKMIYGGVLSAGRTRYELLVCFAILLVAGFVASFYFWA